MSGLKYLLNMSILRKDAPPQIAPETKPRPETFIASISKDLEMTICCSDGPDMARRTKEKSYPLLPKQVAYANAPLCAYVPEGTSS